MVPLFALSLSFHSLYSTYVLVSTPDRGGGGGGWVQLRLLHKSLVFFPSILWRWKRGGECSTECISFLYFSGKNPPCRKGKETSRERGKHPLKGKEENPSPREGEEKSGEEKSPQGKEKRIPPQGNGKRIPLRGRGRESLPQGRGRESPPTGKRKRIPPTGKRKRIFPTGNRIPPRGRGR
jgi:hypothetical protein